MTRSQGKQYRKMWAMQVVHVQTPVVNSAANLVLLSKMYLQQDRTIYSELRMNRIRTKWMALQMKTPDEKGGLTCVHCGRKGLLPWTDDVRQKAVLDHILEISDGGSWHDPANFQVSCDRCNNMKDRLRFKRRRKLQLA